MSLAVTATSFEALVPAGAFATLLLILLFSRGHRLPPGPHWNVAGEFRNATMPEVFEKWRRQYGALHSVKRGIIIGV